ncbi:MAG: tetratricopeptide repeat protein [Candidatus Zixiibacteriota bacterium]
MKMALFAGVLIALMALSPPVLAENAPLSRAQTLDADGLAAHRAGRLDEADRLLSEGLSVLPSDDPEGRARRIRVSLLRHAAELKVTQGRPEDARQTLAEAQAAAKGDPVAEADVLNILGLLAWSQGDLDQAEKVYLQARSIFETQNLPRDRAWVVGNLGLIALDRFSIHGQPEYWLDKAERAFIEARDVFANCDSKIDVANQWSNLGLAYRYRKKYVKAEKAHREALKIDREIGYRLGEVDDLGNLGRVAEDSRNVWKARDLYREAFQLAQDIGYARGISHHGLYLIQLLNGLNRFANAEPYGAATLAAAKAVGNDFATGRVLEEMALIAKERCRFAEARTLAEEASARFVSAATQDSVRLKIFLLRVPDRPDGEGCSR